MSLRSRAVAIEFARIRSHGERYSAAAGSAPAIGIEDWT
jgi:hypothetical protein